MQDFLVERAALEAFRMRAAGFAPGLERSGSAERDALQLRFAFESDLGLDPVEHVKRLRQARVERTAPLNPPLVVSINTALLQCTLPAEGHSAQRNLLGVTEPGLPALADCQHALLWHLSLADTPPCAAADAWLAKSGVLARLASTGHHHALAHLFDVYCVAAGLRTLSEAVADTMRWPIMNCRELPLSPAAWHAFAREGTIQALLARAEAMGLSPSWDCERARTIEGNYLVRDHGEQTMIRALMFAPHADVLWLVAPAPDLDLAARYARTLRARHPDKLLVYQLADSAESAVMHAAQWQTLSEELQRFGYLLLATTCHGVCSRYLQDAVRFG